VISMRSTPACSPSATAIGRANAGDTASPKSQSGAAQN
jgi:hypothetical protein